MKAASVARPGARPPHHAAACRAISRRREIAWRPVQLHKLVPANAARRLGGEMAARILREKRRRRRCIENAVYPAASSRHLQGGGVMTRATDNRAGAAAEVPVRGLPCAGQHLMTAASEIIMAMKPEAASSAPAHARRRRCHPARRDISTYLPTNSKPNMAEAMLAQEIRAWRAAINKYCSKG